MIIGTKLLKLVSQELNHDRKRERQAERTRHDTLMRWRKERSCWPHLLPAPLFPIMDNYRETRELPRRDELPNVFLDMF
jgi:hypothetical protein